MLYQLAETNITALNDQVIQDILFLQNNLFLQIIYFSLWENSDFCLSRKLWGSKTLELYFKLYLL